MSQISWELIADAINVLKQNDCPTERVTAVFHPDCKFDEFDGMTLQQAKDAGLLPNDCDIILQSELP